MTSSVRIGPDYFATMGIPLLAGRSFAQGDGTRENRLAIINQAAARSFWPGRNPVGSHILSGSGSDPRTDRNALEIVGVVGDTKYNALREDTQPILYEPVGQGSARTLTVLIRTGGNPRIMMAAVQAELRAAGAAVPASRITTLEAITADSLAIDRLLATLSGFFAFLALLLAALGLYGVMAYSVGRRSPEIGIRMALGARQADILWMIQRESLLLVAAGIAAGIPGGLAAGRLISSYLYGIGWSNPMSAACVAATLLAAGALAASLPAWRAARISPMVVLRSQ
jgi:predicted permease